MKKIFPLLIILAFYNVIVFPNAAMPGFWNTGSGRNFVPFFLDDSIHFGKIQMKKEQITINLFKGYAVVKGDYFMFNPYEEDITMRTGYPVNGLFFQDDVYSVHFNELSEIRLLIDEKPYQVKTLADYLNSKNEMDDFYSNAKIKNWYNKIENYINNWYVWETTFKAKAITKLTIYYIVNTNNAVLRKEYSVNKSCGFTYILETGEAWGKNIEEGKIIIQLFDDLTVEDIEGIITSGIFLTDNKKIFLYEFYNLKPNFMNNILIRYGEHNEDFNYEKILEKKAELYSAIDLISVKEINTKNFIRFEKSDFTISTDFFDNPVVWIFSLMILLTGVGIFLLIQLL